MLDGMNIMFAGDSAFEHSKKIASLFIWDQFDQNQSFV